VTAYAEKTIQLALVGAGMFGGDVHLRAYADLQRFGDTVGRPLPTVEISIADPDDDGIELSAEQLTLLRGVLYDDTSYRFEQDVAKCNFTTDVSLQSQAGVDTVEAVISFKCSQVVFMLGKPGGRWLPSGSFDVKPARAKLLELAKAMLNTDASHPTHQGAL
jgi:hypothetical protein